MLPQQAAPLREANLQTLEQVQHLVEEVAPSIQVLDHAKFGQNRRPVDHLAMSNFHRHCRRERASERRIARDGLHRRDGVVDEPRPLPVLAREPEVRERLAPRDTARELRRETRGHQRLPREAPRETLWRELAEAEHPAEVPRLFEAQRAACHIVDVRVQRPDPRSAAPQQVRAEQSRHVLQALEVPQDDLPEHALRPGVLQVSNLSQEYLVLRAQPLVLREQVAVRSAVLRSPVNP